MVCFATMTNTQPTLSRDAAMSIKRMYEERGPTGRRLWSYRDLAKHFAVSETTIMRVLRGLGSFMSLPTPQAQDEMRAEAAASLAKLRAMPVAQPAADAAPKEGDTSGHTEAERKRLADYGHGPDSDKPAA